MTSRAATSTTSKRVKPRRRGGRVVLVMAGVRKRGVAGGWLPRRGPAGGPAGRRGRGASSARGSSAGEVADDLPLGRGGEHVRLQAPVVGAVGVDLVGLAPGVAELLGRGQRRAAVGLLLGEGLDAGRVVLVVELVGL